MSQESEDYITPIFPVSSKEEIEENDSTEDMEDFDENEFTMLGGASRRLWPTVEQYKAKFLDMFTKGYSSVTSTYLPALSLSGLVPNTQDADDKIKTKLPEGGGKDTSFKIVQQSLYDKTKQIGTYRIKELKKLADFAEYPKIFSSSSQTAPVFYLSVFLTKALQLALDLDKKAKTGAKLEENEINQLFLLGEIVVRLYILFYINIFTQNDLCVDKPSSFDLYTKFVVNKEKKTYKFSELLTELKSDLENATNDKGIKVCLFGKDTANADRETALNALYDLLKDFGMIYFFNEVLNVDSKALLDSSKVFFFENMKQFLEKMIGSAETAEKEAEAARKAKTDAAAEAACSALKGKIDRLTRETRKALTDADIKSFGSTKAAVEKCFKDFPTVFPPADYGFAAAAPPAADDCEKLKTIIDTAIKTKEEKLKITDEQIKTFMKPDGKTAYTRAEVEACLKAKKGDKLIFPAGEYGLAPVAEPVSSVNCEALKKEINAKITPIDKKYYIQDEKIATLKKPKTGNEEPESYTRKEIESCIATLQSDFRVPTYILLPAFTEKQKNLVVKDLIGGSPDIPKLPLAYIESKLGRTEYTNAQLDKAKVEALLDYLNVNLGAKTFEINSNVVSVNTEFDIVDAAPDGWCFYNAIVRQISDEGAQLKTKGTLAGESVDRSKTLADDIKTFITTQIKDDKKQEYKRIYDTINGQDSFDRYISNLSETSIRATTWADPDFGIGLGAAFVKNIDIEIYIKAPKVGYQKVATYSVDDANKLLKSDVATKDTSKKFTVKLLFINKSHYQIMLDKVPASGDGDSSLKEVQDVVPRFKDDILALIQSLNENKEAKVSTNDGEEEDLFDAEQKAQLDELLGFLREKVTRLQGDVTEANFKEKEKVLNEISNKLEEPNIAAILARWASQLRKEEAESKYAALLKRGLVIPKGASAAASSAAAAGLLADDAKILNWYNENGSYVTKAIASYTKDVNTIKSYLETLPPDTLTPAEKGDLTTYSKWATETGGKYNVSRVDKAKELQKSIGEKSENKEKLMEIKLFGDNLWEMNKALANPKMTELVKKAQTEANKAPKNDEVLGASTRILQIANVIPSGRAEGNEFFTLSSAYVEEEGPWATNLKAIKAANSHINAFNISGGAKKSKKGSRKNRKQDRKTRKASRGRNTRRKNRKA